MKNQINLLEKKAENLDLIKKRKYFTFISIFILITYFFITAGVFIFWNSTKTKAVKLSSLVKSKEDILKAQQSTEQAYLSYHNRINQLEKIINTRSNPETFLDAINVNLLKDSKLNSLDFRKGNELTIAFTAASAQNTSQIIKSLGQKDKLATYFTNTEVQNLSQNDESQFNIQIYAKIKNAKTN